MADNTILNVGAGGDTIATKDFGTFKVARGVTGFVNAGGTGLIDVSAATPLPVTSAITSLPPLPVGTNAIGSITNAAFVANAGTNLNTSALALEAGNLATIAAKDFATQTTLLALNAKVVAVNTGAVVIASGSVSIGNFPSSQAVTIAGNQSANIAQVGGAAITLGQALAAASVPVVLPAATITTLTPPAAIAGFALEAGNLATLVSKVPTALDSSGGLKVAIVAGGTGGGVVTQPTGSNLHVVVDSGSITDNQGAPAAITYAWPIKVTDGANAVTVYQTHNTDNQILSGSVYAINTGGVAQTLNAIGNVSRQRETGLDGVPATGIVAGSQQLASPFSTTIAASIAIGNQTVTPVSMTGIFVGSILKIANSNGTNSEAVFVSSVATNTFTAAFSVAKAGTPITVVGFTYNQARDATNPEGSGGTGISLSGSLIYNGALNSGTGGWENARSALGELDGATGKGTAVAAEYEYNGGGPISATGFSSGLSFDRARSINAKGIGSATITTTVAGNTNLVFANPAATNLVLPGLAIQLTGSGTSETVYPLSSWLVGSSATVPLQTAVVNSGQVTAKWDQYASGGPGLTGFLPYGVGIEEEALFNPVDGLFYLERSATTDAMASANVVAECGAVWNGATFDRMREATSDALAITGIPGESEMLWNGTSFDRARSATSDGMATTGIGADAFMVWNGTTFDRLRGDTTNGAWVNVKNTVTAAVTGTVGVNNFPATQPVSATALPLPTGAATLAKQPALGTAGTASTDVLSVQGIAGGTSQNVTQRASTSTSATLQTAAVANGIGTVFSIDGMASCILTVVGPFVGTVNFEGTQNGTFIGPLNAIQIGTSLIGPTATVQGMFEVPVAGLTSVQARISGYTSGSITVTATAVPVTYSPKTINANVVSATPLPAGTNLIGNVGEVPITSGGCSSFSFLSTAAVQSTSVKASAGHVYSIQFFNVSASAVYARLYNQATAPATTDAANILWRGAIPGNATGAGFSITFPFGLAFTTGVGLRCSAAIGDADATALTVNTVIGDVIFK